jgi:hypothetical protein
VATHPDAYRTASYAAVMSTARSPPPRKRSSATPKRSLFLQVPPFRARCLGRIRAKGLPGRVADAPLRERAVLEYINSSGGKAKSSHMSWSRSPRTVIRFVSASQFFFGRDRRPEFAPRTSPCPAAVALLIRPTSHHWISRLSEGSRN